MCFRYNTVRNTTYDVAEAYKQDVEVESNLLPPTAENFKRKITITNEHVRMYQRTRGLCTRGERVIFDKRAYDPLSLMLHTKKHGVRWKEISRCIGVHHINFVFTICGSVVAAGHIC